jgi:hypothetical protein
MKPTSRTGGIVSVITIEGASIVAMPILPFGIKQSVQENKVA